MTWGFGSPRKHVVFHSNPFLNVDKEEAEKKTLKLLDSITTSQEYVTRKNQQKHNRTDANHWTAIYIFDVALEKKGKSSRLDAVCEYFESIYPKELFYAAKSKTQLEPLYDSIPEGKQYIFIGVEDGTSVLKDRKKKDKNRSKTRRHICKKKTGMQAGVLIQYVGTHRWWEIDPLLKGDNTLVAFGSKTDEMSDWDSIQEKKWISLDGLAFLDKKEGIINKIETSKGKRNSKQLERDFGFWYGMAIVRNSITKRLSVFYLPEIDRDDLFDLILTEKEEKPIPIYLPHVFDSLDVFDWKDKIFDELKISEDYQDFTKYWDALIIKVMNPNVLTTSKHLGSRKDKNYFMLNALSGKKQRLKYWRRHGWFKDDPRPDDKKVWHPVFGYILNIRGEKLFEQFTLNACKKLEIPYSHKPQITHNNQIYEDDLQIGESIIINLKCGQGVHTYQPKTYKTTRIFAQNGYETYILYYDLETHLAEIYDKTTILESEGISVGSETTEIQRQTLSSALSEIFSRLKSSSPSEKTPATIEKKEGT